MATIHKNGTRDASANFQEEVRKVLEVSKTMAEADVEL